MVDSTLLETKSEILKNVFFSRHQTLHWDISEGQGSFEHLAKRENENEDWREWNSLCVLSLRSGHNTIHGAWLVRSNIDESYTERSILQRIVLKKIIPYIAVWYATECIIFVNCNFRANSRGTNYVKNQWDFDYDVYILE